MRLEELRDHLKFMKLIMKIHDDAIEHGDIEVIHALNYVHHMAVEKDRDFYEMMHQIMESGRNLNESS